MNIIGFVSSRKPHNPECTVSTSDVDWSRLEIEIPSAREALEASRANKVDVREQEAAGLIMRSVNAIKHEIESGSGSTSTAVRYGHIGIGYQEYVLDRTRKALEAKGHKTSLTVLNRYDGWLKIDWSGQ